MIVENAFYLQLSEMRVSVDGLEKERDFYFGKLRDIEVICQEYENDNLPIVKQIMDILYATEVCEDVVDAVLPQCFPITLVRYILYNSNSSMCSVIQLYSSCNACLQ